MLKDVALFICDEVSMISNLLVVYIHKRLSEIFKKPDELYGGNNMLFFGDLLQLAPVKNGACFQNLKSEEKKKLKSFIPFNPWSCISYDELTINVRQQNDKRYAKILEDIRIGELTNKDEDWLLNKCLHKFKSFNRDDQLLELAKLVVEELEKGKDYTVLLPTNNMVRQVNDAILKSIPGNLYKIRSYDNICGRRKSVNSIKGNSKVEKKLMEMDADPRNTAGLERELHLKKVVKSCFVGTWTYQKNCAMELLEYW